MKRSPGQKRKLIVQGISLFIFLIITYFASQYYGKIHNGLLAWTNNSYPVVGTVVSLNSEEEEYRTRKGRKRSETLYYVQYRVDIDGESYEEISEIKYSLYNSLAVDDPIDVIVSQSGEHFDLKANVDEAKASNNFLGYAVKVGIFTTPACLFLYYILSVIFVREAANALPEGFYNSNSWLDIDDFYLIWLADNQLISVKFDKNEVSKVQNAYQKQSTFDELVSLIKKPKVVTIPLAEITEVTSKHNSDLLSISVGESAHSIEFLNQAVKHHALDQIKALLPQHLIHTTNKKSRFMAVLPWLVLAGICAGVMFFLGKSILSTLLALFVIVKVLPKLIARLISPTVVQTWQVPEVSS
ncbi:hypothetical protein [Pseudoalteromonas sp. G4]|uniref:hypothetical protein n=1 Tax=Pseudoalteromonas sp. G4 TaxID=2992761 RepID=UPI00237E6141|nr:hypothetical protein [Pseudoalteromonas sp. G4]MDE3271909.1 hypothetical protein [Pseudoalteromonas sp. G4]